MTVKPIHVVMVAGLAEAAFETEEEAKAFVVFLIQRMIWARYVGPKET
jgi:hypothetical protein